MADPSASRPRSETVDSDPFSAPEVYYGDKYELKFAKNRSFSQKIEPDLQQALRDVRSQHRRGSQDATGEQPRKFLVPVESTLKELLSQEDTDKNCQITIDDSGPKVSSVVYVS